MYIYMFNVYVCTNICRYKHYFITTFLHVTCGPVIQETYIFGDAHGTLFDAISGVHHRLLDLEVRMPFFHNDN